MAWARWCLNFLAPRSKFHNWTASAPRPGAIIVFRPANNRRHILTAHDHRLPLLRDALPHRASSARPPGPRGASRQMRASLASAAACRARRAHRITHPRRRARAIVRGGVAHDSDGDAVRRPDPVWLDDFAQPHRHHGWHSLHTLCVLAVGRRRPAAVGFFLSFSTAHRDSRCVTSGVTPCSARLAWRCRCWC